MAKFVGLKCYHGESIHYFVGRHNNKRFSCNNLAWGWEEKVLVKVLLCINFQGLCMGNEKIYIKRAQFIKKDNRKKKKHFLQEIQKGLEHLSP